MKNLIIVVLLILLILVFFGINAEFGWISFEWKSMAVIASVAAGPFQFLKRKFEEKAEEKEEKEEKYRYRVLEHKEYMQRTQQQEEIKENNPTASEVVVPDNFHLEGSKG